MEPIAGLHHPPLESPKPSNLQFSCLNVVMLNCHYPAGLCGCSRRLATWEKQVSILCIHLPSSAGKHATYRGSVQHFIEACSLVYGGHMKRIRMESAPGSVGTSLGGKDVNGREARTSLLSFNAFATAKQQKGLRRRRPPGVKRLFQSVAQRLEDFAVGDVLTGATQWKP